MDIDIFSHALTAISQGVLISGNDGLIIYFNEAFSEITGYVAEDVIGNTCSFMQGVDTDTATVDAIRAALARRDSQFHWHDSGCDGAPVSREGAAHAGAALSFSVRSCSCRHRTAWCGHGYSVCEFNGR